MVGSVAGTKCHIDDLLISDCGIIESWRRIFNPIILYIYIYTDIFVQN